MVTLKKINLSHHIVCGDIEIQDFLRYKVIKHWQPKDPRHKIFHQIKYPNHDFYQGGWGPEMIIVPKEFDILMGRPAKVWCTSTRAKEIKQWIIDNLYTVISGDGDQD